MTLINTSHLILPLILSKELMECKRNKGREIFICKCSMVLHKCNLEQNEIFVWVCLSEFKPIIRFFN